MRTDVPQPLLTAACGNPHPASRAAAIDPARPPREHAHMPQAAVIAQEFGDVVQFVRPPRFIQRALFGVLAPLGRALGYRAYYERYLRPYVRCEPVPELMALVDAPAAAA